VDEFNSPEQVAPNVWVAYSGVRGSDGVIKVDRAVFSRNATSKKEGKFRDKYDAVVKEPDYGAKKAGEATIKGIKPFTILADKGLQERISRIGASLVPAYQRALADNDPAKIKFRFYVVDGLKFASIHSADGSVFISSGVFGRLSNEAQLAGVIAADIASVVQEHDFRIHSSAEWSQALCWSSVGTSFLPMGLGLPVSALVIANGFGVQRQINSLYGQAGRLAIEYSVGAGYDPREVRSAFKALSKKSDVGMKLKGSERAYYMAAAAEASNELGLAYSGTDFSKLNSDAESYRNLAEEVKSAREK
jgi:predicted Zn-dependent protease